MRKIALVAGLLLCFSAASHAQDYHHWEVFGGFDYLDARACVPTYGCNLPISATQSIALTQAAYGWHLSLAENKVGWLGGVMDFSGDYANRTINFGTSASPLNVQFNGSMYPFLFGPRFYYRRGGRLSLFGNPLIGGVHARLNIPLLANLPQPICIGCPSLPISDTKWAYALGGGADYAFTDLIAFRAQADWIRSHFAETLARDYQNNYRVSVGIVFKFR